MSRWEARTKNAALEFGYFWVRSGRRYEWDLVTSTVRAGEPAEERDKRSCGGAMCRTCAGEWWPCRGITVAREKVRGDTKHGIKNCAVTLCSTGALGVGHDTRQSSREVQSSNTSEVAANLKSEAFGQYRNGISGIEAGKSVGKSSYEKKTVLVDGNPRRRRPPVTCKTSGEVATVVGEVFGEVATVFGGGGDGGGTKESGCSAIVFYSCSRGVFSLFWQSLFIFSTVCAFLSKTILVKKIESEEEAPAKKKAKKSKVPSENDISPANADINNKIVQLRSRYTCNANDGSDYCWAEGSCDKETPPNHHIFRSKGNANHLAPPTLLQRRIAANQPTSNAPVINNHFSLPDGFLDILRGQHTAPDAPAALPPLVHTTHDHSMLLPPNTKVGVSISIANFCHDYDLDVGISTKFSTNGYKNTSVFYLIKITDLQSMKFLPGEIAELRARSSMGFADVMSCGDFSVCSCNFLASEMNVVFLGNICEIYLFKASLQVPRMHKISLRISRCHSGVVRTSFVSELRVTTAVSDSSLRKSCSTAWCSVYLTVHRKDYTKSILQTFGLLRQKGQSREIGLVQAVVNRFTSFLRFILRISRIASDLSTQIDTTAPFSLAARPHREADGKNGSAGEETPNLEVNELEPGRMPGVVGMQNSSWDVYAVGSIRQPEIRGPLGPCEELKLKGVPSCCFFAQSFRSAE
ncbi:hypothetical protein B0H13DRAFT_1932559 [Mycena leptocephala]|nr:hypothetical protein B0H13DRAFT_1932559 [Mycena leptocephala]